MSYSQTRSTELYIDFRVNSSRIDTSYSDNGAKIREIKSVLRELQKDTTVSILNVSFCGTASPEGSDQTNRRLSKQRLETLETLIRSEIEIPEELITRDDNYISWNSLISMVESSDIAHKNEVLEILKSDSKIVGYYGAQLIDDRILRIMELEGGKVWDEMKRRFFNRMRYAVVVIVTEKEIEPLPVEPVPAVLDTIPETPSEIVVEKIEPQPVVIPEVWGPKLHVKTNALGLMAGITNGAVEVDLIKHLSLNIPVYYSAWNYVIPTVKFRTLYTQPELRFWLNENNDGFFFGPHFGVGSYNVAVDGTYRFQDHDGKTPALGGGLGLGYRMPLSKKNPRWKVEFTLGAGAYSLKYDRFFNNDDVTQGPYLDTISKTYWGIDGASVSFMYMFDLKKKNKEGSR